MIARKYDASVLYKELLELGSFSSTVHAPEAIKVILDYLSDEIRENYEMDHLSPYNALFTIKLNYKRIVVFTHCTHNAKIVKSFSGDENEFQTLKQTLLSLSKEYSMAVTDLPFKNEIMVILK